MPPSQRSASAAILFVLVLPAFAQDAKSGDAMKNCPMHDHQALQAAVESQGDQAMGFPHQKGTHHFRMAADGGAQFAFPVHLTSQVLCNGTGYNTPNRAIKVSGSANITFYVGGSPVKSLLRPFLALAVAIAAVMLLGAPTPIFAQQGNETGLPLYPEYKHREAVSTKPRRVRHLHLSES